jgi:hypothetical protein
MLCFTQECTDPVQISCFWRISVRTMLSTLFRACVHACRICGRIVNLQQMGSRQGPRDLWTGACNIFIKEIKS